MGRFKSANLKDKIAFYSKVLFEFYSLLSPVAFILFINMFAEYLLVKFSKPISEETNVTGASICNEMSSTKFYSTVINLRNAIIHYDKGDIRYVLDEIANIDYLELLPTDSDDVISHCIKVLRNVDWKSVENYLLTLEY